MAAVTWAGGRAGGSGGTSGCGYSKPGPLSAPEPALLRTDNLCALVVQSALCAFQAAFCAERVCVWGGQRPGGASSVGKYQKSTVQVPELADSEEEGASESPARAWQSLPQKATV